ncbi:MAG: YcaO-like family protein [Deltaproteobacteria bacterium]|nr:YcaO-like family protein [Deltaproteobacteria bacterium]
MKGNIKGRLGRVIDSCLKHYTFGQDKTCNPRETIKTVLDRLKQKKVFILNSILRIDHLDKIGIPAYICHISSDLAIDGSCGKGVTPKQAKASALMEVVERYSCEWFIKERGHFFIDSYDNLRKDAISPLSLLSPLPSIYKTDEVLRDLRRMPLPWTESFSLTHKRPILLPLHWFYLIYGTTGLAAGNTIEEATLQAIGEVVERHNVSRVIEERLTTPSIDISSIDHFIVKSLIKKFFDADIKLFIKDFSLDFGIPTIGVLAYDENPPTETVRIYNAAGAHLNRNFAAVRALIELAQHRAQIIFRENKQGMTGGPTYCFPYFRTLKEASYLIEDKEVISFKKIPTYRHKDFKEEIEQAVDLIGKHNLEVIVTKTTHPEIGLPAVVVTIPGARLNRPSTRLNPYFFMAKTCMDFENYKTAIEYFERAIEMDPQYKKIPKILCQIAICYKRLKMYRQAKNYFERAITLAPNLLFSKRFVSDFMEVIKN